MRRSKRLRHQADGDSWEGGQQKEEIESDPKIRKQGQSYPQIRGRSKRGKGPRPSTDEEEPQAPSEILVQKEQAQAKGKRNVQAQGKQKYKNHQDGPTRQREEALWAKGYKAIGGLDEAVKRAKQGSRCCSLLWSLFASSTSAPPPPPFGGGPLARPPRAACCVLPQNPPESLLKGLNDSKLLNEAQRDDLYARITTSEGVLWAAQVIDSATIDRINILQAALRAMREAAMQLPKGSFDYLLVDGNKVPEGLHVPAEAVVKGDSKSSCIAAASIIAKVTRDRIMYELDAQYPAFNFRQHKGYGVPEHTAAIRAHGPCAIHRRSFQPVRGITGWTRAGQLAEEAAAAAGDKKIANLAEEKAQAAASAAILQLEAA
ncbi:ribonuclease H-like domain-containing protein [Dunaliella salina]|uniref:Ribonuclease n=1 Tax=Dunaliella salina TaxID=3046 RepID=A0ABQ7GMN7_DUNSA|nr:ribonuclease H-like domain-containing protein [Dunaliella salina]|eukprot:KAF5835865.1 ribonuclease H-like domain-containing protein [Dunaliella salina]